MYEYFKHIAKKSSCQMNGVCSIHPSVSALYELLLNEVREIANYLVKLKEFKITDSEVLAFCIDVLSIFMINTSFNQTKYLNLIKKLHKTKIQIKNTYLNYCKENRLPCEIIDFELEISENTTINELINFSQEYVINRQKGCEKSKFALFELIILFSRLCAINIVKIKKIDQNFNDFDYEIMRFFALTNGYSIRNEKIKRRILEFSSIMVKIKEKLYACLEEKFGKKENAIVNMSLKKGKSILVSGDDLDELYDLLEAIENFKTEEKINVYTNGALFLAHFYPYFKNNRFLCGHWGGDSAEYDFSRFPGAILITRNFIQKIDSLYRGALFSNKIISFNKVTDIENKNYNPVLVSSLKLSGFIEESEEKSVKINYSKEEIFNSISNIKSQETVIIIGRANEKTVEGYKDKTIFYLNFSYETDFIVELIRKLKDKNVKVTVFFAQCNLLGLENIFALLNQEVKLALTDCPYAFINPHVIQALKEEFNVEII